MIRHTGPAAASRHLVLALLVGALAACGGEVSPTAPPSVDLSAASGGQASSAISGVLMSGGASASASSAATPRTANAGGVQVSIDGTAVSATSDGNGNFFLVGVPSGNVTLRFQGGGTSADLVVPGVGSNEHVQLIIQVQPTSAQLVNDVRGSLERFVGRLAGVDSLAPSFTLDDGTTVFVDQHTWWDTGGDIRSFGDLVIAAGAGQAVLMTGRAVTTADNRLHATVVKADFDDAALRVDGIVVSVARRDLSMTLVDGTRIVVDPLVTEWAADGDYGTFDELANAVEAGIFVHVDVGGSLQDDGTVLALTIKATADPLRLVLSPDEWDIDWIGSGSPGTGGSAVEARISGGPFESISSDGMTMEGPDGAVAPVDTELGASRFTADFTKGGAISIVTSVAVGAQAIVTVRGTLVDGTPFEVSDTIVVVDEEDGDGGGNGDLDPGVAAEAIVAIHAAIDFLNGCVDVGDISSNNAKPLRTKLESALKSVEKLNGTPAINQLEAFLNQLDSSEKTGKISSVHADTLEDMVGDIISLLQSG